ncbi:Pvc16 family protein [Planosporangium sp. 12N6]|uniref:Pvc16 family protein n=1 Tax=Planosporangium spinosum TaxID=3402278 RepID=UPI003CEEBBAA
MIGEVGAALRALFDPLLPPDATVRLGAPPPEDGHDVLNLFLAEVREDSRGVAADWDDVRDEHGILLGRRPPTRRFNLLYLVTSWAADPYREQRLLDVVLAGVVPERRLDQKLLTGALAESPTPVLVRFADAGTDLYRAFGPPTRTVLGLVVNAPLVRALDTDLAAPAERLTLDTRRGAAGRPEPGRRRHPGGWRSARVAETPVHGARETPVHGARETPVHGAREGEPDATGGQAG